MSISMKWIMRFAFIFAMCIKAAQAELSLPRYFAHNTLEDKYGVIAPWYDKQNGQFDFRVQVAAELLYRYPWANTDNSAMAGPHYIFNPRLKIDPNGTLEVLEATDHMNGRIGQRFKYLSEGLTRYYRYSGDPRAIAHLKIGAGFILEYCLTSGKHHWPGFPISVPCKGKPYGRCSEEGNIQLDLCAGIGTGMIRTYQLTGDRKYLDAAEHWGDVFAEKCNYQAGQRPWNRFANPKTSAINLDSNSPTLNIQTGGVVSILIFLDELIRLGYTGEDGAIIKARDAGRAYLRDKLLPVWCEFDTWARHYWDWEHPVHGIVTTGWVSQYMMDHKDVFGNWRNDVRNILSLYLNRACVSPKSNGGVYSGAWSFPEGPSCCGRSLDSCPIFLSRYFARYGDEADSEWGRELARRQIMLGTYHFKADGSVEDNIDGGQIIATEWSEIIGTGPILCVLDAMEWLPGVLGPARENHIMRSSSVVTSVIYGDGLVRYSTFDAPDNTIDVLRLAFKPQAVIAGYKKLKIHQDLSKTNGFVVRALKEGDYLVTIRHDSCTDVAVSGRDPQVVIDDGKLQYSGCWQKLGGKNFYKQKSHVTTEAGAEVNTSFLGNQVRIVGSAGPDGGKADVYIDGKSSWSELIFGTQSRCTSRFCFIRTV